MKLKKVLDGLHLNLPARLAETEISGISDDSRGVKKGYLFIAIKGLKHDGHKFIDRALISGAAAVIADKRKHIAQGREKIIEVVNTRKALSQAAQNFYYSPSKKLKVIGITGTNGKTTTSLLIESIFKEARIPCGVIGTIGYKTGSCVLPAARTTPGPLEINALLGKMIKNTLRAAVMEVSSHALNQKRIDGICFDAAIFTNLTHEHLDYHGTLKRYFASKMKIFENLKKDGIAIVNADEKFAASCTESIKNHMVIRYGFGEDADVSAKVLEAGPTGSSFILKMQKQGTIPIRTPLLGMHNISNILAAASAAVSQGVDINAVKRGIENVKNVPGRLEPVKVGQAFRVFVDYAHTHNAMENVLRFLKRVKSGNIITVFGCGGERDRKKRPLMGAVAQKFSDFVVITDDNPRNENPVRITREILKGMNRRRRNYCVVPDRKRAIEKAFEKALAGDTVLIAGKGHEKAQIVGRRELAFDDKKAAEDILRLGMEHEKQGSVIKDLAEKAYMICADSRKIKKGEIFLAINGKRFDGHDFVDEVFKKGARAAIVSKTAGGKSRRALIKVKDTVSDLGRIAGIYRRKFDIPVVAVTGSAGKTTAKDMIAHVLSARYNVLKSEKSNNNFVGLPLTLTKLTKRHQVCVLEMGMNHAGEIDKLCKIAGPNMGVITNIGTAHIGPLGSMRNIFMAKTELLRNLPEGAAAILNKDDAYLGTLKRRGYRRVYFGINEKCRFQALNPEYENNLWRFSVGKEKFELAVLGKHNIYNALAAIVVARELGIGWRLIRRGIKSFRQKCSMRLECKNVRGVKIINDSYNSNPSSMARAMETLADYDTGGKKIIVSGDMFELGTRAKTLHEKLGSEIAKSSTEVLITLGKFSKFTNRAAAQKGTRVLYHAVSPDGAADFLRKIAKPGDVVLVKGSRGMRMERVIEAFI